MASDESTRDVSPCVFRRILLYSVIQCYTMLYSVITCFNVLCSVLECYKMCFSVQ